jgi:hypothetical protein
MLAAGRCGYDSSSLVMPTLRDRPAQAAHDFQRRLLYAAAEPAMRVGHT